MAPSVRTSFAMLLVPMLIATIVVVVIPPTTGADTVASTRSSDKYYIDGSFFIPSGWDRGRMYLQVFLQNRDRTTTTDVFGEGSYKAGQVANSFESLMDGSDHSSGANRRVMLEIYTDTDCYYCPGADGAAHRIAESDLFPDNVSIIEWHVQTTNEADPYETTASRSRMDFYGLTGTPSAVVDGELIMVGGDANWNNYEIDRAYLQMIDLVKGYPPLAAFTTKGWFTPNGSNFDAHVNVSVELIDALPQGNWSFVVSICEDMYDPEKVGVFHRFIPRYTRSALLTGLNIDRPRVAIDDEASFGADEEEPIRDNVTIEWTATDPEDGTDLSIDIRYQVAFGGAGTIAADLENTGAYTWRTREPRLPDGLYNIMVVATDSDGNAVSDYSRVVILDNLDVPLLEITGPRQGDSLSGRFTITWNSSDDEDERIDLLVKISLSSDLGVTWEVLTYNFQDGGDWEVDDGSFDFNTAVYDDVATYMLRIQVRDLTDWSVLREVGPFEIYNNDPPKVRITGPTPTQVQTGNVMIEYDLSDPEDVSDGLRLLSRIRKEGIENWTELFNATPPSLTGNMSVPTATLSGDGQYELELTVFDSRGGSDVDSLEFPVYDPDAPVIWSITVPAEPIAGSFLLEWNASDPDAGETLSYTISISGPSDPNWTEVAKGVKASNFTVDVSGLADGPYVIQVLAVDSSGHHLSDQMVSAEFAVDNPQGPVVDFISPLPGFRGTIDNRTLDGYLFTVRWIGSDPDGGRLTYVLSYQFGDSRAWVPFFDEEGYEDTIYIWNVSKFSNGTYFLKVEVKDGSGLEGEKVLGDFTLKVPVPYKPPVIPPDDNKDNNGTDDIDLSGLFLIGGIVLAMVVIIAVLAAIAFVAMRKRRPETPVVPREEDVDLSVPDFDRGTSGSEAQETAEHLVTGEEVPHNEDSGQDQKPT